jgi:hypothetical protein
LQICEVVPATGYGRGMRRLLVVLGLSLVAVLTSACAPMTRDVCPAIGYVSSLTVDATRIPDAARVQLCAEDLCPTGVDGEDGAWIFGSSESDGIWVFSFIAGAPEQVVIRVTDAEGAVIQEREHRITWTHSTARCGGPSTADPLVLHP